MDIDLLYFDACPFWQTALHNLQAALHAEGVTATIRLVPIADEADAADWKFPGSPSFRVNGEDWWRIECKPYSLACRKYLTPHGMFDVPTVDMLCEQFHNLRLEVVAFVQRHVDHFNEVLVHDDQYDSYSIKYENGSFWLINFSPRENALYSQEQISLETAIGYLQKVGFSYSF